MVITKTFRIPVLPSGKVKVSFFDTTEAFNSKFKGCSVADSSNASTFTEPQGYHLAFRVYKNSKGVEYPTPGIITHEGVHLLNILYGYIGYEPSIENDELEAYFLEWVVNKIHSIYNQIMK